MIGNIDQTAAIDAAHRPLGIILKMNSFDTVFIIEQSVQLIANEIVGGNIGINTFVKDQRAAVDVGVIVKNEVLDVIEIGVIDPRVNWS